MYYQQSEKRNHENNPIYSNYEDLNLTKQVKDLDTENNVILMGKMKTQRLERYLICMAWKNKYF